MHAAIFRSSAPASVSLAARGSAATVRGPWQRRHEPAQPGREHEISQARRAERAERLLRAGDAGILHLGSLARPLGRDDVLMLFDLLRRAQHVETGLTIRLTASPGTLSSLVDELCRADGRHGVCVDLLWDDTAKADLWRDLEALSACGLFVRLVFAVAPADRDWQPWIERAAACGVADVRWPGAPDPEATLRLDRWRLAHGLPLTPSGRG